MPERGSIPGRDSPSTVPPADGAADADTSIDAAPAEQAQPAQPAEPAQRAEPAEPAEPAEQAEPHPPTEPTGEHTGERADGRPSERQDTDHEDEWSRFPFGRPGQPLRRSSPFVFGFTAALGVLLAIGLTRALLSSSQVLVLIVVSMFLAVGLNPAVEALQRRGLRRSVSVSVVFLCLLLIFVGFGFAIAPPLAEQTGGFVTNLPEYLDQLQSNRTIRQLDTEYQVIDRLRDFVSSGSLAQQAFGGIVGVGKVVLGAAFSAFTILVLTLYFLVSLPGIKRACYELVPRSRRRRVQLLGDEILGRIGGYVSGQMIVATCAGVSSFIFLQIVGLSEYALALSLLVALFGLVPMIGATIGAILVVVVGFLDSPALGIICLVFYILYQQVENYLIYPRVMRRAVDVPPALTIVAALIGGTLLGVVGALLAIPTAAAALLIVREVVVPRQERT